MREIKKAFLVFVTCILLFVCVTTVSAEPTGNIDQNIIYKQVLQNHTVFFGEEHLDVTRCVGTTGPTYVVAVDLVRNVTDSIHILDPTDFTMPTDKPENVWVRANDAKTPIYENGALVPAFVSQEPVFAFDIWNLNTDMKADSQVQRGTLLQFKLSTDTNLDDITTRADYDPSKGYINFKVNAPNSDQYLQLMTLGKVSGAVVYAPTTGLDVNQSPGWTWPLDKSSKSSDPTGWMTGWRDAGTQQETDYHYKIGAYNVTGLCNVNNMYKNRQLQGYTWDTHNFEMTARTVAITVNPPSGKSRDVKFTAVVNGMVNTTYQLFITDECPTKLSGKICDRPPFIMGSRADLAAKGIVLDPMGGPYTIGSKVVVDCCKDGLKIREALPSGDSYPSIGNQVLENGTRYYAEVTTDSNGKAEIPFWIDTAVGAGTYTIQVQDDLYQQKATGTVQVSLGQLTALTKTVSGEVSSSFFVGDEIWIDGTNLDSNMSYVWITGPGLEPCGVNIFDSTSSEPVSAVVYDTKDGMTNYWRITPNWNTNKTPMGAGNYTIWVTSSNPDGWNCASGTCMGIAAEKGICAAQKCPTCAVLTSIPITLIQPELTVNPIGDVTRCCCPGYPCGQLGGVNNIWINGTSGGNNCKQLQIWMFGKSQFGTSNYLFTTTPTYCDDTFSYDLNAGLLKPNGINLCQLASGEYDIIVQAPGANGMFDINRGEPESNNERYVTSTLPVTGSKEFKIDGKDALSGGVAVKSLKDALNKPGIDDKYVYLSFNLEEKKCEGNYDFVADRTEGNSPLTVQFNDTSYKPGVAWSWSSNGVVFSTEQKPKYIFNTPGKYTIKMDVTDEAGTVSSVVKDNYINVLASPSADFVYYPQSPAINQVVNFTDQSTGSPTSWMWNFGDGSTSSLQSPGHAYTSAGVYDVSLEISTPFGIGTPVTKQVTVVHDKPAADFVGTPTESSYYPASVSFTDLSTGVVTAWNWQFITEGNVIATSTEKDPKITFNNPGVYTVALTITNNGGTSTVTKKDYITIGTGSYINLKPGYNHVSVPREVTSNYNTLSKLFAGVDNASVPYAIYGADNGMTNWTNVSGDYAVTPQIAYRVYSTANVTIQPAYIANKTYSRNLSEGWEGIGIMAMQPTPANVALSSLGEKWDKVLAFNPATQRWEYPIIRGVDDDKTMDPTVGYLIQMNSDAMLIGEA